MNCYKCESTENLSVRKANKYGIKVYTCEPCRRNQPRLRKNHRDLATFDMDAWRKLVKEKHHRIALKYRDEAFMKARGLI